jgi:Fungal chitosanase of glycosyl hydrolase group 75
MARLNLNPLLISLLALPLLAVANGRQSAQPANPPAQNLRGSAATQSSGSVVESAPSCPARNLLFTYEDDRWGRVREFPIWQFRDSGAFFFTSGMTIDADGAPNAYNAENTGLDDLANAGAPGHWEGILQDKDGNPLVQGPGDPFPGYYISCTALADWTRPLNDPARFVDASKIPYIVLPGEVARQSGARVGDFAVVVNLWNGNYSYAIFADVGTLGEGSIALANNLGISSNARHGGTWWGVLYLVFPGSGDHRPKSLDEIDRTSQKLLGDWGGVPQLRACASDQPSPPRPPFAPAYHPDAN